MHFVFVVLALGVGAQRFEGEDGTVGGDAEVIAESGLSGTGYVAMKTGSLSILVENVTTSGFYNLKVKYNAPDNKKQNLVVNGAGAGEMDFPKTEISGKVFVEIEAAKKLNLNAGTNTIEITNSWGWIDVDYIELEPWVETPFNIDPNLVSPSPSLPAVELYNFLKAKFADKKVISGVMTLQGGDEYSLREPNWIKEKTGKYPALLGLDFMHQTGKDSAWYSEDPNLSRQVVCDAQYYYSRGGIVHLMWHWRDPSKRMNGFYSPDQKKDNPDDMTFFSATKAADPSKPEYQNIIADLDVVAAQLFDLQNKGIAVLWRPFHEAAGKWFWWGYEGAEPLKKLWKIMFDYFTINKALHNLIWVWTSNGAADALDWYPGDAYVDIVGADIYTSTVDHSSQVGMFEQLKEVFGRKKIVALSECGSIPDPNSIVADGAHWSFFMPWYGGYTIPEGATPHNSETVWNTVMGSSVVLSLDDMPKWASAPTPLKCEKIIVPNDDPSDSGLSYSLNFFCFFLCFFLCFFY